MNQFMTCQSELYAVTVFIFFLHKSKEPALSIILSGCHKRRLNQAPSALSYHRFLAVYAFFTRASSVVRILCFLLFFSSSGLMVAQKD